MTFTETLYACMLGALLLLGIAVALQARRISKLERQLDDDD